MFYYQSTGEDKETYKQTRSIILNEWISIEDRLPKSRCKCALRDSNGFFGIFEYTKSRGFRNGITEDDFNFNITDWMSLEPPID